MKNWIIIIFILSLSKICYSQPELTVDWFYSIGDTTLTAVYYPDFSMTPNEGSNIIWDISNAPTPSFEREKYWVSASELTYHDEFPSATIGFVATFEREFYFEIIDSNFNQVGFRRPGSKMEFIESSPILAYNDFSFGQTQTNNYSVARILDSNMDTTYTDVTDEFTFAGFGTVITPLGNYTNCIMTKLVRTSSNPTYNLNEYQFHKDKLSNVIAVYAHRPFNTEPPRRIEYRLDEVTSSINELHLNNIQLKSIQQNSLTLNVSEDFNAMVKVFELGGKQILNMSKTFRSGDNEINIAKLTASNFYFLLVIDAKSGAFRTFKFYK